MTPSSPSQPDTVFLQGPSGVSAHAADPTSPALSGAKKENTSLTGNFNFGHSDPTPLTKLMFSTLLSPAKFSTLQIFCHA